MNLKPVSGGDIMAKPKRIGHLVLNVKDVEASTKFYTEILGFEISLQRPDGSGTFLTCGKIHHDLALFKAPEDAAPVVRTRRWCWTSSRVLAHATFCSGPGRPIGYPVHQPGPP